MLAALVRLAGRVHTGMKESCLRAATGKDVITARRAQLQ